ncbi:hypothetical protein [Hwangdonia seohaensis]|uniref:Uncharacterized protein n=1 Tax=Hwangdonia seohaensis TaxID=1240727 RepID=A0ABW3RCR9_9FLAO|nr:hypothetical protein [Hwangdonia seohaensis]
MNKHSSPTEKHEIELQRFINKYKDKTYDDMHYMVLEIKSSSISEFEYRLKDALLNDISKMSFGPLCSIGIVVSRLIDNNTMAKNELKQIYSKIQEAKQRI